MWSLLANDRWIVFAAFSFLLLTAVSEISIPHFISASIFSAQSGQATIFRKNALLLLVFCIASGITSGIRGFFFSTANLILVKKMRNTLYSSLLHQDVSFYDATTVGELASRVGADCHQVSRVIAYDLNLISRNLLQATGSFIYLLILSWPLGLCSIAICTTLSTAMISYGRYQKKAGKLTQEFTASANEVAQEISLMRTVRVYGTEQQEHGRYNVWLKKIAGISLRLSAAYRAISILVGGVSILSGKLSAEQLTKFLLYSETLIQSTWCIGDNVSTLMQSVGASEKVFQLMDLLPIDQFTSQGTTAWGIGLVIGPALGGLLAQPAQRYPHIFKSDSLFGRFPYFLPCLVISILAVIVTIDTFWLPESLHNHKLEKSSSDSYKIEEGATTMESSSNMDVIRGSVSKESLLKNRPLMSAIAVYCIFSLQETAYTEIFSLWAVSPRKLGGLSYSSEQVGSVLAITGVGMFICQLSLYSYADKIFGPILVARICGVLTIPVLQSYPFIALLSGLSLSVMLNSASVIRSLLSVCVVTSTFVLQNRAVDQDQRGAANGLSMTLMSLFKAVGPACGGALLSWSEKRQDATFLPGTHMLFFILNVVQLIGVVSTFKPFLVERKQDGSNLIVT